ncbi:DUF1848 domain-containing protein [Desulfovibrio inopinatus]|uniref:DUF1848 domain-containing protein n=1 Tax=Desulfovibrio inopinatus TaxID=102109 RepID=UPI00146F9F6A|nr:DUF1848 domain-containing protein [Desulfovibrio inopinatus]
MMTNIDFAPALLLSISNKYCNFHEIRNTLSMIISASRRTDIPAFYSSWINNRLHAGYCDVPNPFNIKVVSRVSLTPTDVDAIVFWTRYPAPIIPYLPAFLQMGHNIIFLITVTGYPRFLEPCRPSVQKSLDSIARLAEIIGPGRIVWRYDPIIVTERFTWENHRSHFRRLAKALSGCTQHVTVSFFQDYTKNRARMEQARRYGFGPLPLSFTEENTLLAELASISQTCNMTMSMCASGDRLLPDGVQPGACIDGGLIEQEFGVKLPKVKDPGQRKSCGCAPSRDIGMYDSCTFGCTYCYAVKNFDLAAANRRRHKATGTSLLPLPARQVNSGQLPLPLAQPCTRKS